MVLTAQIQKPDGTTRRETFQKIGEDHEYMSGIRRGIHQPMIKTAHVRTLDLSMCIGPTWARPAREDPPQIPLVAMFPWV